VLPSSQVVIDVAQLRMRCVMQPLIPTRCNKISASSERSSRRQAVSWLSIEPSLVPVYFTKAASSLFHLNPTRKGFFHEHHHCPPFADPELAVRKVQIAEDLWNTRDPERVAAAYTEDTQWRNRTEFLTGRAAVIEFLQRK